MGPASRAGLRCGVQGRGWSPGAPGAAGRPRSLVVVATTRAVRRSVALCALVLALGGCTRGVARSTSGPLAGDQPPSSSTTTLAGALAPTTTPGPSTTTVGGAAATTAGGQGSATSFFGDTATT